MRWTMPSLRWPAVAGLASLAALSVALILTSSGARAQSGPVLGIDADATGNSPTSLGQRDVCVEVENGATFDVDVIAQDAQDLYAFESYVSLDVDYVNVIDRDATLFLSAASGTEAFDTSESVPEEEGDNGLFRVGAAIIQGDEKTVANGSGVLARLTLKAVGAGVTTISVGPIQRDVGIVASTLTDFDGNHIGDVDGDSFFDGAILDAQVAVDQDCPSGADGPIAAITGGSGGDGVPAWVFAAAAVGLVAAAGFGGMALIRMRRSGPRGTS